MSASDDFRRAMEELAPTCIQSRIAVQARGGCEIPNCACGMGPAVVLNVRGYLVAFTSPEQADALADAIADCRVDLWGPRTAEPTGGPTDGDQPG